MVPPVYLDTETRRNPAARASAGTSWFQTQPLAVAATADALASWRAQERQRYGGVVLSMVCCIGTPKQSEEYYSAVSSIAHTLSTRQVGCCIRDNATNIHTPLQRKPSQLNPL